jgi:hypothetical protein
MVSCPFETIVGGGHQGSDEEKPRGNRQPVGVCASHPKEPCDPERDDEGLEVQGAMVGVLHGRGMRGRGGRDCLTGCA